MLMILVCSASGGCVDHVINNRINHQFTLARNVHFMNSARVCWIIKRTIFNMYVCINYSWRYECSQLERCNEKPRHQKQFFQNLDNFCI